MNFQRYPFAEVHMINIVIGTRPEIIKMSPVIRECTKQGLEYLVVHTGQHYSYAMDRIFFEQLGLPFPEYNLDVGSGTHGAQTAAILSGIENILIKRPAGIVLVQGDTNTVCAGALAAAWAPSCSDAAPASFIAGAAAFRPLRGMGSEGSGGSSISHAGFLLCGGFVDMIPLSFLSDIPIGAPIAGACRLLKHDVSHIDIVSKGIKMYRMKAFAGVCNGTCR